MNTIVVEADGSEAASAALRFAVREAALRGASVRAISAWEVPISLLAGRASLAVDPRTFERVAKERVEDALAEARRLDPNVECDGRAIHGQAVAVLVETADADDLLVVGRRGHGRFVRPILGSACSQVANHARCPVIIVPHPSERANYPIPGVQSLRRGVARL